LSGQCQRYAVLPLVCCIFNRVEFNSQFLIVATIISSSNF
jgi:hypothetical protein